MRGIVFALLLLALAGCTRNIPVESKEPEAPLSLVKPKSGGEMALLQAGTFTMGDSEGQEDEKPHAVSVSAFYIDRHLVTQEIYQGVMSVNPSKHKDPRNPVEKTQWFDAVRFCNKCSELDGLTPCYDLDTWKCNFAASGYRLPTEAEWEYACRAGTKTKFSSGDDETKLAEYAWFRPLSKNKPHPVGGKAPNPWGLFDMHGNVWQWCNDWYGETYPEGLTDNPTGPAEGKERVLRGGAYDKFARDCRSARRRSHLPAFGDACLGADSFGFRRVCGESTGKSLATLGPKS